MAAKSERAKANARASSREYMRRKRAAGYKEPPLTPEQKEKRKAVYRRHHAKNAEKRRAYSRQWKKEHPEQVKANKRKSWAKVSQDPEVRAKARAANRRFVHGPNFDAMWAGMWDAQKGLCYLCEEPLVPGFDTHIDHDHSCCPKGRTCSFCRRGLACTRCNKLIGHVKDSPELLRKIAGNLEPAVARVRAQIATKQQQDALWPEAG